MTEQATPIEVTPLLKPRLSTVLVDSDIELSKLNDSLRNVKVIAIDAERASGFRYGQRAYLIQLAIADEGIFLLDTTIDFNESLLTEFRDIVNGKTWIIHAASQDIPCLADFGLYPSSLFDTELAGRILGFPKVSLGTLCENLLGIGLAKEHSAVDWSARPLPLNWLNYAALDVDVLFDLWKAVEEHLNNSGKYEIAAQEFQHLTHAPLKQEKADRWRSTNGIHELKQARPLTVLKSLWEAREQLAKEKDVAPGRLVPDASLIALVKSEPKSKSELSALRAFTGRASRSYIDLWWAAYEHGMKTKDLVEPKVAGLGIPNHRNWPSKFPEANIRLQWMKQLLRDLSDTTTIPVENLITPDIVRQLCFSPPEVNSSAVKTALVTLGARPWQIDLVVPLFLQAFEKNELPPTKDEPIT